MSLPPRPGADRTLPLADALARSEPLGALLRRLQDSQARWAAARSVLPTPLASLVRPGPLDDESWTLLAPSGAAAAKLRQCLPQVQAALNAQGLPSRALRVKVRSGG